MNCETANEYIMKYFDGEISEAEELQFREHLKNCGSCRDEFNCMKAIFTTLENKTEIEPPDDFEAKVMEKIAAIEEQKREKSARMIVWLYNGATTLSIILLMVFVADMKQVSVFSAFERLRDYFSSFSGTTAAIIGAVRDIFGLLANAAAAVAGVVFSLVKSYYYVFIALFLILFIIQKLLHYVGTRSGEEAE